MLVEWLKWGALLAIAAVLSDVVSEIRLLREDLVRLIRWYMEDDGK